MKPTKLSLVRWVQPVTLGTQPQTQTPAGQGIVLTGVEVGVLVEHGRRMLTLVPWSNVKQAEVANG